MDARLLHSGMTGVMPFSHIFSGNTFYFIIPKRLYWESKKYRCTITDFLHANLIDRLERVRVGEDLLYLTHVSIVII